MNICDLCSHELKSGEGYAFYSSTVIAPMNVAVGNLMLCQQCTDKALSEEAWSQTPIAMKSHQSAMSAMAKATKKEDVKRLFAELRDQTQAANAEGIIATIKSIGISREDAKSKARELAKLWWIDKEVGQKETRLFWTTSKTSVPSHAVTLDTVAETLVDTLGEPVQKHDIKRETLLREGLGIDDVEIVDFLLKFEEKTEIDLPDSADAIDHWRTVGDFMDYVAQILSRPHEKLDKSQLALKAWAKMEGGKRFVRPESFAPSWPAKYQTPVTPAEPAHDDRSRPQQKKWWKFWK